MSFGLRRKRVLDVGTTGVGPHELPPLPDEPRAARMDPRVWFPDPSRPFEIEIGSGKGTFLLQQGAAEPGTNFLGIEWAGEFYEYAADRCRRAGLTNVRLLNADAGEFLRWRCADGVARVIHLYFPDPWPKTRHHKRRMVSDAFLREAWRVLQQGGELRIVTDHDEYWAWMEVRFARWCGGATDGETERPAAVGERRDGEMGDRVGAEERTATRFIREPFERVGSSASGELVGSNFERKYRREGRPFHATILRKPDAL